MDGKTHGLEDQDNKTIFYGPLDDEWQELLSDWRVASMWTLESEIEFGSKVGITLNWSAIDYVAPTAFGCSRFTAQTCALDALLCGLVHCKSLGQSCALAMFEHVDCFADVKFEGDDDGVTYVFNSEKITYLIAGTGT
jgi:hypothetical protein